MNEMIMNEIRANIFEGESGALLDNVDFDADRIIDELIKGNAVEVYNSKNNEPFRNWLFVGFITEGDGFASLVG